MNTNLVEIAVNAPLLEPLTYTSGPNTLRPGQSVKVPLGKREVDGIVLGDTQKKVEFATKDILGLNDERQILPQSMLKWLHWLSQYYAHPIGQVFSLAFPPLKESQKKRKSHKSPVVPKVDIDSPKALTEEQQKCFTDINQHNDFSVHLLHGVTGSGKTEVYLQLLTDVIHRGQQALILVPEISLTPQLVKRFSARFPNQVAVVHSHLTEREKTDQWNLALKGERKILVGARSALFCPLDNIGLIIVDEEHEPSFKQEEKLKYQARDAAIVRAKLLNCPIVLGSATPSLESWHNANLGKYHLHQMKHRVSNRPMPEITLIDLKEKNKDDNELPFWLSKELHEKLQSTLQNKKQAALFLNRRGVAQNVQCFDCGFSYECPNCAINLTLHGKNHLVCHYCSYTQRYKDDCPECHSDNISAFGMGTEQIEKDICQLFPEARVARADRDEISRREQIEDLITAMEDQQIDILVGTQMIAKGLDFPSLDLVGLILADVGFHVPDFRASERSFQLLTQVSGRAGRHSQLPGQVVIQTLCPEQASITYTINNDYAGFAAQELQDRQNLGYPPFGRLVSIRIQGNSLANTGKAADQVEHFAKSLKEFRKPYDVIKILGPCPAPIAKIRNKYRFHLLLKSNSAQTLQAFAKELLCDQSKYPTGTKVQIDVDPYSMM